MLTDLDAANLCCSTYWKTDDFDVWFDGSTTGDIVCGVKKYPDITAIVFRGSTTIEDWARDFFAVPHAPFNHPALGMVHAGFYLGMDHAYAALEPYLKGDVVVIGHSLAAARAMIFSGLMTVAGIPPQRVIAFGEPKPGFEPLAKILEPVDTRSYRNCDDVVTHVPFSLLDLRYVHPKPLIPVNMPPAGDDPWGFAGAHHIQLYRDALQANDTNPRGL